MEGSEQNLRKAEDIFMDSKERHLSNDVGLRILMISCAVFTVLVLYLIRSRYSLNDLHRLFGTEDSSPRISFTPQQAIIPTRNPFNLILDETKQDANESYAANCLLTCKERCIIRAYWGTKIKDVYAVIYQQWQEFCGHVSTRSLMEDISDISDAELIFDPGEKVELLFKCRENMQLGDPPRDRYPLVVLLIDANYLDMPPGINQIASIVTIFHLKDLVCPGSSHVISQLVRIPHGVPYDLKKLYMSTTAPEQYADSTVGGHANSGAANIGEQIPATINNSHDAEDQSLTECNVCMTTKVEIVILPCRHACVCHNCFQRLTNCPMCRNYIISYFHLENSTQEEEEEEEEEEDWQNDNWES